MLSYITFPIHTQYQPWLKENESGGNLGKGRMKAIQKLKEQSSFSFVTVYKTVLSRQFVNRKALNWDKKNTKC